MTVGDFFNDILLKFKHKIYIITKLISYNMDNLNKFPWKPITEIPTEHWNRNTALSPLYLVRCGEKDGVSILGYSHYSFITNHWIDCCHATVPGLYKVTEWTDIKI